MSSVDEQILGQQKMCVCVKYSSDSTSDALWFIALPFLVSKIATEKEREKITHSTSRFILYRICTVSIIRTKSIGLWLDLY